MRSLAGFFAGFVMRPLQAEVVSAGFNDSVDPALAVRAARWHTLDWVSWPLTLVPGVLLALALGSRPTEPAVSATSARVT